MNTAYKNKPIPLDVIKNIVSSVSGIPIMYMEMHDKKEEGIRKRDYVVARQISMTHALKHTTNSLSKIGMSHGGRDHATVLHARKTINNLLEINDHTLVNNKPIQFIYKESEKLIRIWKFRTVIDPNRRSMQERAKFIKILIRSKCPLEKRNQLLNTSNECPMCGNKI